jgi:hypothetical protein
MENGYEMKVAWMKVGEGQGAEQRMSLMWTKVARHRGWLRNHCRKAGCENGGSEVMVGTERSAKDGKHGKKTSKKN